jgi:hypothetical protein
MMSLLPLSSLPVTSQDDGMRALHASRPTAHVDQSSDCQVLVDAGPDRGLVSVPRRRRDALLARLRGRSLGARLAAGEPPEHSRLLAIRAVQITDRPARRRLAGYWEELVARSRSPQHPFDPRAPIARAQVYAAADEIQHITDILRANRPVAAHGVAIASTLLTTAASPAYRLGGRGGDLTAALTRAVTAM